MAKKYIIGDTVKFKEDIYNKLEKYLLNNKGDKIKENKFIIDSIPQENRVIVIGKVNTEQYGEELRKFTIDNDDTELIQQSGWIFNFSDTLEDRMQFNSIAASVFEKLKSCNCRDEKRNYFDIEKIDNEFMLSFISLDRYIKYYLKEKLEISYSNSCRDKYKLYIKPIKLINSLFKKNGFDELKQNEIDAVMGALEQKMNAEFIIVDGKDITKYYNEKHYINAGGNLNNSCMRYSDKSLYFGIYEDNAKMLILKDKEADAIYGRALIWDMQTLHDGEIEFMDRIYCTKNSIESMFLQYAHDHDMAHLPRQSYHLDEYVYRGHTYDFYSNECHIILNKNVWDYGRYPFLDTFYNCPDISDNKLYAKWENEATLDNTGSNMDFNGNDELTKMFLSHCLNYEICVCPDSNDWKRNKVYIEDWIGELDCSDEDEDDYDDWDD